MRALHTASALQRGPAWAPVAMLLSAPFIGLLYAILLPPAGIGMLAWFGVCAASPHTVETGNSSICPAFPGNTCLDLEQESRRNSPAVALRIYT